MWSVKPIDTHLSRFWPINSGLAWAHDLLDNPLNWPPHQNPTKMAQARARHTADATFKARNYTRPS